MNLGLKFKNKTFLITGASGFIGGRIIERLCRDYHCHVKALVHNVKHLPRIARFDIEIIPGDILDKKLVSKITQEVNYVIHCAVGNTPDIDLNSRITVEGARNVFQASLKNKVKQLIYFSTMSVYGCPLPRTCNEKTPYKKVLGDYYNNDKIEAEKIAKNYIKKGLPGVILQPTIVYGPYAGSWTTGPINEIKGNSLLLVDKGQGVCNPIYIDNLVDAVFLALGNKDAIGKTFIISDGKGITWEKFFGVYEKMLDKKKAPDISTKAKINIFAAPLKPARRAKKYLYDSGIYTGSPEFIKKHLLPILQRDRAARKLSENRKLFFKQKCVFEIKKAKKILGYSPKISFSQGMKLTEKWLKYARYCPDE